MKKVLIMALAGAMLVMASGCSKEEPEKTQVNINVNEEVKEEEAVVEEEKIIDAKALADSLLGNITYKDELSEMKLDTAAMFYDFGGIEIDEAYIYESSGATAEEIVVLKCKDSDSANKAKEIFKKRIDEQIESYTDYVPEEVPKLKDAVIITSKEFAVLCVSDDSGKAKSIIEDTFTK